MLSDGMAVKAQFGSEKSARDNFNFNWLFAFENVGSPDMTHQLVQWNKIAKPLMGFMAETMQNS